MTPDAALPVNIGRLERDHRGDTVVVDECAVCGSEHRHGFVGFGGDGEDTRAPHCGLSDEPTEYLVVLEGAL